MKPMKVTDREIVDVLLGHAEAAQEQRVRRAVQTDLKAAATYAEWSGTAEAVCRGLSDQQAASARIHDGVMARLRTPQPGDEALDLALEEDTWTQAFRPEVIRRRRAPIAAAAVALLAGLAGVVGYLRSGDRLVAEVVEGDVTVARSDDSENFEPLATASELRLPVALRLAEGAFAEMTLPPATRLRARGPANLEVSSRVEVNQSAGVVDYRVTSVPDDGSGFTVLVPQGAVVDLGTEFEVTVNETQPTVVRVRSGTVRVEPSNGAPTVIRKEERAILTSSRAIPEADPEVLPLIDPGSTTAADDQIIIAYQPVERVLDADSALLTFIRPQEILLGAQAGALTGVTKAPPFTTTPTPAGTLRTTINGTPAEIAVVSDEKVNGSLWVYLDENGNTDLTDDVHFEEGVDFANGGLFAAGLMGRNDALWLRRPIAVDTSVSPPQATVSRDRMECVNRVYLDGVVTLPQAENSPLAGQHRFLLLDTDADGDLADEDGALGVWVSNSAGGGGDRIQNAAPLGQPSSFMGYRWRLARKLSGEYALMGQKLPASAKLALRVGDTLPRVKAETVAGQSIEVAPPGKGYLLLYAWSTWYSACNRDVPFDINDLYPKFKDRGLQMVGVSMDYRKEDLERYLDENKIAYPQIFNGPDATQGIAAELGLVSWPAATLVDAAGVVVKTGESAAEIWSFLDANLPK